MAGGDSSEGQQTLSLSPCKESGHSAQAERFPQMSPLCGFTQGMISTLWVQPCQGTQACRMPPGSVPSTPTTGCSPCLLLPAAAAFVLTWRVSHQGPLPPTQTGAEVPGLGFVFHVLQQMPSVKQKGRGRKCQRSVQSMLEGLAGKKEEPGKILPPIQGEKNRQPCTCIWAGFLLLLEGRQNW